MNHPNEPLGEKKLIELGLRHKPFRINRKVFSKTKAEKLLLKDIRKAHNYLLRSNGFNPKKQMNVPGINLTS
ncbi:MAG: hypothetical protein N4A35_05300 [Flavobacteriales bacterium]|jgi:hypothetical protein|nr:hypothetical protein [Flavobacteriales bacterium]